MAKLLSPKIKKLLAHSVQQYIAALIVLALAVALTFFEDICRKMDRPHWLILGIGWISVWLFIVDAIDIVSTSIIFLWRVIREVGKDAGRG